MSKGPTSPVIKRKGSIIPTVCLVLLVLLCTVLVWLSTAGLPRFIVDKIEVAITAKGVPIKIDKVKLNIFRKAGLEAVGIKVYARPDDQHPVITADSVSASLSPLKLIMGEVELRTLQLENGNIAIPVSDSTEFQTLTTSGINISATFHGDYMRLTTTELKLQGIPIHIKGSFNLKELLKGHAAEEEQEKLVIPAIIKTCQNVVDRVYHQIEQQDWQPHEYPELHIDISAGEKVKIHVDARAPKYDIEEFHFRDAVADINYEGDRLIINNLAFKTVDPTSHVQLMGGYEIETRKLHLTLESDAALLDMAKALAQGELLTWLNKFSHKPEHTPHINLKVNTTFGENFTLNDATFDGEIDQNKLHIGDSIVDHLHLSFFYSNGNFNINNLTLKFPDGKINFRATSNNGSGKASIQAELPIIRILTLVNEFTDAPIFLPAGLRLGNKINFDATAELTMPEFKAGDSYQNQFIPRLQSLQAQIQFEKLQFLSYSFNEPEIALTLSKGSAENRSLFNFSNLINLQITATNFAYKINKETQLRLQQPQITLIINNAEYGNGDGDVRAPDAQLQLLTAAVDLNGIVITDAAFNIHAKDLHYNSASYGLTHAEADFSAKTLSKDKLRIDNISLSTHISAQPDSTLPASPEEAQLKISADAIHYDDSKLGKFETHLEISESNEGQLTLHFIPESETAGEKAELTATTVLRSDGLIIFDNIQAFLPCSNFQHIIDAFGIKLNEVALPHNVTIVGSTSLHIDTMLPKRVKLKANIPTLERTPHRLKAFTDKKITIATDLDLSAEENVDGHYSYSGNLKVTHSSGELTASLQGNTASHLHVTGTNTIRPDIVDMLLDYKDAHEILRDFKFDDKSQSRIENIAVDVSYDNGTCVKVDCDITLNDVQYQLLAIEDDDNGNEIPNKSLGKLPFTDVNRAKAHLTANYRKGVTENGRTVPTISEISLSQVELNYNNRAWIKLQDFSKLGIKTEKLTAKRYRESTLSGDKITIDIEKGAVRLNNVRGTVYAAYSLGMFYPELRDYMSIMLTPYPTQISTQYCQFPIYSDSKEKMEGNISVSSEQLVGLDLLGTHIPFTKFSGFIQLTDDYVYLDRMNARCWEGTVNAAVKIGISDKAPAFDGQVSAQNMNLKAIAKSYGTKLDSALCEGQIRFRAETSDTKDFRAYGTARIVNGNLMTLSLFQPIGAFVSDVTGNMRELDESARKHETQNVLQRLSSSTGATINAIGTQIDKTAQYIPGYNHIFAYDLQNAFIEFIIDKGHFKTNKFKALGYNLKVTGYLDINLDTTDIYGNMWPQVSSLPTVVLSPITFLSDFMLDIVIHGKIDDIQWSFRLDKRINDNSPKTADSAKDQECANKPR